MDAEYWSWWRFAWGAVGAAAPEVVRLFKIVSDPAGSAPRISRPYFPISLVFIALGGAFAVAWGENNPLKCLWVGVSLPVIVSSLASQIPPGKL